GLKQDGTILNGVESQIRLLKKTLQENLISQKKASKIRMLELDKQISSYDEEIAKLPQVERAFLDIERKYVLNEELYNFLLEKKAESEINKASIVASNRIIDPALAKGMIAPKKAFNYLLGFLIGLILPIGGIVLSSYFDNRINELSEIQQVSGANLLGVIGHSDKTTNLVVLEHPKTSI